MPNDPDPRLVQYAHELREQQAANDVRNHATTKRDRSEIGRTLLFGAICFLTIAFIVRAVNSQPARPGPSPSYADTRPQWQKDRDEILRRRGVTLEQHVRQVNADSERIRQIHEARRHGRTLPPATTRKERDLRKAARQIEEMSRIIEARKRGS